MAAAMCGVQAQVLSAAQWSIGLRLNGATRAGVTAAVLTERSLVRTFGPRGTVHLLAAEDLPMWTAALSAIPQPPSGSPAARLSPGQFDAVLGAITQALAGGELTLEELSAAVVATAGSWAGDLVVPSFGGSAPRWQQALGSAGYRGIACYGAGRGRQVTYASTAAWLPAAPGPAADPAKALAELVRRFLSAYGPATPASFAQWIGAARPWATELFATLGGKLTQVEFEGQPAWLPGGDVEPPAGPPGGLRLLPYFDSYLIAGHPRALLFPGLAATRALNKTGQAGTLPVLLIDGTVAGIWHQRRAGQRLRLTVEPFAKLSTGQRDELEAEAGRLARFLGATAELTIGPVSTGWHA